MAGSDGDAHAQAAERAARSRRDFLAEAGEEGRRALASSSWSTGITRRSMPSTAWPKAAASAGRPEGEIRRCSDTRKRFRTRSSHGSRHSGHGSVPLRVIRSSIFGGGRHGGRLAGTDPNQRNTESYFRRLAISRHPIGRPLSRRRCAPDSKRPRTAVTKISSRTLPVMPRSCVPQCHRRSQWRLSRQRNPIRSQGHAGCANVTGRRPGRFWMSYAKSSTILR